MMQQLGAPCGDLTPGVGLSAGCPAWETLVLPRSPCMAFTEQTLTPAVSFGFSSPLACVLEPEIHGPCLGLGEPHG